MQEETEKLSRVIHCLLQAGTIMERLVRVSGNLGTVLDQLHMHGNHMQHTALRRQPTMTMQQLYEQRQTALKRHRVQYERQHPNNMGYDETSQWRARRMMSCFYF